MTKATSATEAASSPILSRDGAIIFSPAVGNVSKVGLKPATPQKDGRANDGAGRPSTEREGDRPRNDNRATHWEQRVTLMPE